MRELAAELKECCMDLPTKVPEFEKVVPNCLNYPMDLRKNLLIEIPKTEKDKIGGETDMPEDKIIEEEDTTSKPPTPPPATPPPKAQNWSRIALIAGLALVGLVILVMIIRYAVSGAGRDENVPTEQTQVAKTYASLKVQLVKPWAYVYIDDEKVATTPIAEPVKVETGRRLIRLENPQTGGIWQEYHNFQENEVYALPAIELKAYAYIRIERVKPWADIYIDDEKVATTPIAEPIKVESGKRSIRLENPQTEKKWQQDYDFQPDETFVLPEVDLR